VGKNAFQITKIICPKLRGKLVCTTQNRLEVKSTMAWTGAGGTLFPMIVNDGIWPRKKLQITPGGEKKRGHEENNRGDHLDNLSTELHISESFPSV